jgi:hypothetical protein
MTPPVAGAPHKGRQADLDRYKFLIAIPMQLMNGWD